MKPKAFLAALLASVLFVLLVAACFHRGEDPAQNCLERFGGPYPDNGTFQGDQLKVVMEEKAEGFAEYQRRGLDFSEAVELKDIDQLEESVKHNLTSPYGLTGQLYNYVIRPDCKIFVAVWTEKAANRGNADFREALTGEYVTEEGSNIDTCPGGRDFLPATREDTMINFYPEDLAKKFRNATETPQSPCWLGNLIGDNKAAAVQENGLLDALSKHFMLAQREPENAKIDDFNEKQWPMTQVAYAGEMFVDPIACTFTLNTNSGTYRPDSGLQMVTDHFRKHLEQDSSAMLSIGNWC